MLQMLKSAVFLVLVGVIGAYVYQVVVRERHVVARMNQAAAAMSEERFAEAARLYEEILESLDPERDGKRIATLRSHAARCHYRLAEDPSKSLQESLRHYRKAYQLDPASITNPTILKLLDQPSP